MRRMREHLPFMKALLALFTRSLRLDLRSKAFFWSRMGAAIGVLWVVFRTEGAAAGLVFFTWLVAINFVIICLAAVSYFAAAITEEKEEGTLGLLRLTDLGPFSILLGKSTSKLIGGLLLLLVQVPFAMLAVTLGGVRIDQVIDCYLLLAALLFFACNAAVLGSVMARRSAGAGVATAAVIILFVSWPFLWDCIIGMVAMATGNWQNLPEVPKHIAAVVSAPAALVTVLDSRTLRPDITGNLGVLLGGGLAAFLLARCLFERFCSEAALDATIETTTGRGKSRSVAAKSRPGRPWDDAICWRDFYFLHGGKKGMVLKGLVYLALAIWLISAAFDFARARYHPGETWYRFAGIAFPSAVAVTLFESLLANSRIYRLEQQEKTLSALFVLPQRLERLLHSKRRAAFLTLVPGLFFVSVAFLAAFAPVIAYAPEQLAWLFLGTVYVLIQIVLNHYFVGWLSLSLRWGAFPAALGIIFLGNYLSVLLAGPLFPWSLLPLIAGVAYLAMRTRHAFHKALIARAAEG